METLQGKVEDFVKNRKILKKDFAKEIGVSPVQLSHWLKGRIALNKKTIDKVVSILDHSL